jgi:hypothetical protein
MKTCVFCGERGGSKEHILAQWMIKKMEAEREEIIVAHTNSTGKMMARPAHKLNNYITKKVCEHCNNNWMSKLETWFQANMGAFIAPEWPVLANEALKLAVPKDDTLARWALKTAIMMNCNSDLDSIKDTEAIEELYKGNIAKDIRAEIAYIEQGRLGKIMSRGFWVMNGDTPVQWQQRHDNKAFHCVMQLNHLAIRIFRCKGAIPMYHSPKRLLPLQVYPERTDPMSVSYRFSTLKEFNDILFLRTFGIMG